MIFKSVFCRVRDKSVSQSSAEANISLMTYIELTSFFQLTD
jgi:hypothetical protein